MSHIPIDEGYLRFTFGDDWVVLKYDQHPDYVNGVAKLHPTKAVDFVGLHTGNIYFIEVKDFRAHRIENKDRLDGDLQIEVAIKVRDTIAGLIGANRVCGERERWRRHVETVGDPARRLRVILWLEDDKLRKPEHAVARAGILTDALKPKLRWLTTHVLVVTRSTHSGMPPDLTVTNLPGAAGHAHP